MAVQFVIILYNSNIPLNHTPYVHTIIYAQHKERLNTYIRSTRHGNSYTLPVPHAYLQLAEEIDLTAIA